MKGRDYRILALILLGSLLLGICGAAYGVLGRSRPPQIDAIWKAVEETRGRIATKQLQLKEGESRESDCGKYRVSVVRLKSGEPFPERYLLRLRSGYEYVYSTDWKPASWDLALIAYETETGQRRVQVVVAKRLKE
jgi:hypothetical protein